MTSYYIPNTNVKANIIDPNPSDSNVSLFLQNKETDNGKYLGSVNAGTSNSGFLFSVGLGGINGAFESSLSKVAQETTSYQKIHKNLYDKLVGSDLSAYNSTFNVIDPLQFSLIQKPNPNFKLFECDGITFIDIFNSKQFPNGNQFNYCMIYLVPPDRNNYSNDNNFLKAVEACNITMIEALSLYNSKHATPDNSLGLKVINNIRMCLFSGGIYSGNTPQNDIAYHNLLGLEKGLSSLNGKMSSIELVNFENSYDSKTQKNVFQSIISKFSIKELA
jgi:hypothetical protein